MEELRQNIGVANAESAVAAEESYVGSIVRSVAGRDAKRIFAIIAVEENSGVDGGYVWLADGRLRRLEKPKRKKIRHFRLLRQADEVLAEKIRVEELTNHTLCAYLKQFESMTQELHRRDYSAEGRRD